MSIMGLRKIFSQSVGIHIGKFRLRLGSLMVITLMGLALLFIFALIPGSSRLRSPRPSGEGPVRKITTVVAQVGGYKVDRLDFEQRFKRLVQQQPGGMDIPQQAYARYQLLDNIIEHHLLVEAAKGAGIKILRNEIDQRIDNIADSSISNRFPDQKMLHTYLKRKGISYQDYHDQIRKALEANRDQLQEAMLLEKLENGIKSQIQVTEETVKDAYRQVKARHILIKPKRTAKETSSENASSPSEQQESPGNTASDQTAKQQARQKAQELLEEIKQGADFAELARKYSDDPASAKQGGELGWFGHQQMVKEVTNAAFALQPGQVSDVVETPFGFHIIKVEDKRLNLPKDFEENKQRYISQQQSYQKQTAWNQFISNLREQAHIEVHDPELRAMGMVMKGRQQEAIALLEEAIQNDSSNLTAMYTLANLYQQQGDLTNAIKYLQQLIQQQEGASSAQVHLELGKLLRKQGKQEEAIQQFADASDWAAAFQYQNYGVHTELKRIYEEVKDTKGVQQEQKWLDEFQQAQAESVRTTASHPTPAP